MTSYHLGVHVDAETRIELERQERAHWLCIGGLTVFVDDADLARIHDATRPAYERPWERRDAELVAFADYLGNAENV